MMSNHYRSWTGPETKEPEQLTVEEQVWMQAWAAAASRHEDSDTPADVAWWADECLDSFKQRFRNKQEG